MDELIFEPLEANDIRVRVEHCSENGCSLLLHKNARIDMNILDKKFGPMGWQREQIPTVASDGRILMVCRVGIKDKATGEWIWKSDVGSETAWAREKGQASDSFKRACSNWGIGRELYTAPDIYVPAKRMVHEKEEIIVNIGALEDQPDVFVTYDEFKVTQLLYDDNQNIVALAIKNVTTGKMAFICDYRSEEQKETDKKKKEADKKADKPENTAKPILSETNTEKNNHNEEKKATKKTSSKKQETAPSSTTESLHAQDDKSSKKQANILPQESNNSPAPSVETSDIRSLKVDVGAKFIREEKTLGNLSATELRWVYGNTKSPEIKKACLTIASEDDTVKKIFIAGGIPVK